MRFVRDALVTLAIGQRLKILSLTFLFSDDIVPNEKALGLLAKAPEGYLKDAAEALDACAGWEAEQIAAALDALAERAGLNRTKGWQPIRAAVTGSNVSPPLPESLALLGRDRSLERIRRVA